MKEIEVQVLGKKFTFNVPESIKNEDFLEITRFVEDKLKKIRTETEDLDSFKLGLLTAMNIAGEYFALKKENEKLCVMLNKINKMILPLEEEGQSAIRFSS